MDAGDAVELTGPMLLEREKMYLVGCLTTLMSYKECLAIALQEGALDIILALLRCKDKMLVHEALRMLGSLLSHRKFSLVFLDANGLEQLMPLPDMGYYANAVALCLSSLATFRGVLEKLCRLKNPNPRQLLTFTIKLLDFRDDVASSNVMQFLARVLAYPQHFLKPFDELHSSRHLVEAARLCAEMRPRDGEEAVPFRVRGGGKGVAKATAHALRNYLRVHLLVASRQLQVKEVGSGGKVASAQQGSSGAAAGASVVAPPVGASGGVQTLSPVQPETEDHVAVACVVVERKGRQLDLQHTEGLANAVNELVSKGALQVLVGLLDVGLMNARIHGQGSELVLHVLQSLHVMALIPVVKVQLLETRLPHNLPADPAADDAEPTQPRQGRSGAQARRPAWRTSWGFAAMLRSIFHIGWGAVDACSDVGNGKPW